MLKNYKHNIFLWEEEYRVEDIKQGRVKIKKDNGEELRLKRGV